MAVIFVFLQQLTGYLAWCQKVWEIGLLLHFSWPNFCQKAWISKISRAFWQKVCRIGKFLQKSQKISSLLLEFWHGDKKSEKLAFYCIFLNQIFAKKLEFQKFRTLFGKKFVEFAWNFKISKKNTYFSLPGVKKFEILAFYCVFINKFLAKILNFLKKRELGGEKLVILGFLKPKTRKLKLF